MGGMKKVFLTLILLSILPLATFSQENVYENSHILWNREAYGGLIVHTSSWGLFYRSGKHKTGTRKRIWELEFVGIKSPKEKKIPVNYDNAKSYIFGKLNYLYFIRFGRGFQKIINHKPFWGGIELRYCASGGLNLGITKPVYLYIVDNLNPDKLLEERYDPSIGQNYIYGRAPFLTGIDKISFHPGLYGKFGINFEYGSNDKTVKALEIGGVVDGFMKPISIMAYEKSANVFYSLYLSISFGGRYNK